MVEKIEIQGRSLSPVKNDEKKICFVRELESLVISNFLLSSSFDDILRRKPNRKRQVINLGIVIFVILQLIRYCVLLAFDIILEVDLETRNNWGDIYYFMGMGGKLIVATGQTANLQSIWFRILCLFQENSNDLNFLQDINDYRLEGNKSQTTLLTGKFKDKFVSMAKKRIKKILLRKFLLWKVFAGLFFLFVPFYCMSLEESFSFKRCVLWILYSFLTFVHANITVIMVFSISGIWHIARYHCQLLTEQLISQIQAIIDGIHSTTSQKLSRDLRDFESSFFVCQENPCL